MSKTPEELAEEWMNEEYGDTSHWVRMGKDMSIDAFLAGYQAAKDEYKVAIDTYNDVAKQMLHEAVRIMTPTDEIAEDVLGASNVPEKPDGWISVKDRLPEIGVDVLISYGRLPFYHLAFLTHNGDIQWFNGNHSNIEYSLDDVTHWMPLPAPPKE
jgi:hypothetical protein